MFYSGIDLHKNNSYNTTINKDGTIIKQSKLPNGEQAILDYFFSIGNIHKAGVESTSNWYWLSELLKNKPIAKTIVAKELARITFHVLKNQTEFKTFKGIELSRKKSKQWSRLPSPAA